MLKKITKVVRQNLLKSDWIKAKVKTVTETPEKRHNDILFAKILQIGGTVHNLVPVKLEPYQTLAIVTDDGLVEEYMNGRVVGQGWIDSVNWGGTRL